VKYAPVLALIVALSGYAAAGEADVDRQEAEAFLGLAKTSLQKGDFKAAELWLNKAEAKAALPGIWEMRGDIRVKQLKRVEAMALYLKARQKHARGGGDAKRVTAKIVKYSPELGKYLKSRDKFVAEVGKLASAPGKDTFAKRLAKNDLDAFVVSVLGKTNGGTVKPPKKKPPETKYPPEETRPTTPLGRVQALFTGKVKRFDSRTLGIELTYDFEDQAQLADWTLSTWAYNRLVGTRKVEKGRLHVTKMGQCVLHPAKFTRATIEAKFRSDNKNAVALIVCADEKGNFYNAFGTNISARGNAYIERYAKGRASGALSPQKLSPFAKTGSGRMSLTYFAGKLNAEIGAVKLEATDQTHKAGQVGFWPLGTVASFDDVRIVGTLDPAWLRERLKGK
jgi:hypothetical protein